MRTADVYKAAVAQGLAGELCDHVVRTRPVPPMLLATLRYHRFSGSLVANAGGPKGLAKFRDPMPSLLRGRS
jgi:hypothetical protein